MMLQRRTVSLIVCGLLFLQGGFAAGADLPPLVEAAPCVKPPQIDGTMDPEEWGKATAFECAVPFVRIDPALNEKRTCRLWVMNSANALYVALQVPDTTVDQSLNPFRLDAAVLAFGRGAELPAGSDRKVIVPGQYRDKYLLAGGKGDADDPHQDGVGAMRRADGLCTFEWAVPLDSQDKQDLQAKPGEEIRFNVVYFDALQLPLTSVTLGGFYGAALDQAKGWGTLRLARDVVDDGGAAFRGPEWVGEVVRQLKELAPDELRVVNQSMIPSQPGSAVVNVAFSYLDQAGKRADAKAKIYFPASFAEKRRGKAGTAAALPMLFAAGYELPEAGAVPYLNRGWIVVSPSELPTNPLVRLMNPDVALLHLARRMPWVDDRRVTIAGGSAGGWMTLLLAAETFPLAAAIPDVPPVNWGYNAAYFYKQLDKAGPEKEKGAPRIPVLFAVGSMLTPVTKVYGGEFGDATWFASSPVSQVSTITCPVSVYWSTADVLVPIDQVGAKWVQPLPADDFPEGFTMSPEKLVASPEGRLTLIEALPKEDYEIFSITVPPGTRRQYGAEGTGTVEIRELPVSRDRRWSITIIDEGAPAPDVDHRKYQLHGSRNEFLERISTAPLAVEQLTLPKLRRLMARYAGREWSPASRLKHLDRPESEQRDVLRGLRTYLSLGPAYVECFQGLYAQLPAEDQVLSEEIRGGLTAPKPETTPKDR